MANIKGTRTILVPSVIFSPEWQYGIVTVNLCKVQIYSLVEYFLFDFYSLASYSGSQNGRINDLSDR